HKFYIEDDGVYRITANALDEMGLNSFSLEGFHLFSRGEEVPVYISPISDVAEEIYIEFYAKKNDGSFDTQLFENPDWQLTDRRSLFTPKAAYYLMWDDSFEGKKIEEVGNDLSVELPKQEPYFMYESGQIYRNIFYGGEPSRAALNDDLGLVNYNFSKLEKGEGFISSIVLGEATKTYNVPTLGVYQAEDSPLVNLKTKVVGQNNDFFVETDHHLQVRINDNLYVDGTYEGHDTPIYEASLEASQLSDVRTEVVYESVGDLFTTPSEDWQSISYTFLTYPRQFDFRTYSAGEVVDADEFYFELQHSNEAYFEVNNFNGGNAAVLYDLNNSQRYQILAEEDLYKIHLLQGTSMDAEKRSLFLANQENGAIKKIEALQFQTLQFTDYAALANQGNYILLSHPTLREGDTDWVQAYSDYRSSEVGGNYNVVLADIQELYDQFAHGIQNHPLGIRHFVNFAVDNWTTTPEHLFLVGKGIGYRATTTPSVFEANFIPTFGHQPSDIFLVSRGLNDYRPQLSVGRLSAQAPSDIENYLRKIQQYEDISDCSIEERAWRKEALFQTVGLDENEVIKTKGFMEAYQPILEASHFGGKVLDIQAAEGYSPLFTTRPFIEEGIGLLHFFGHSTGQIWKTDVVKNLNAYNQDSHRFPVIFSSSSFVGNNFKSINSSPSMSEDWVLTKDRGAVGFLGNVSFHLREAEDIFYNELYQQISQINYNQPIGKALKETVEALYLSDMDAPLYNEMRGAIEQHTFEGDPALVIGGSFERPEYVIENNYEYSFIDVENAYAIKTETRNDVVLLDAATGEVLPLVNGRFDLTSMEEVALKVRVTNLGKAVNDDFEIEVVKIDSEGLETVFSTQTLASPAYEMVYDLTIPIEAVNTLEEYDLVVRINSVLEEDCNDNNSISLPAVQGSTSIKNVWEGAAIKMYPNPVNNELQIITSESEPVLLQLFDLQGKMLQRQFLHLGKTALNMSNLPNGIYWVRLTGENGVWSEQIVKQ
ncbi:MAG: C25 family cysteine peptidase, partial [Chitinophagales bacterium]